ncbi:MAG: hypothetical protein IJT12_05130 [Paludibacteraceae bacterium]|nr:hypothetical protein [Paludibacteraceae bacterium]
MKNMRNKMITMVAGVLLACLLPLAAHAEEWNSTSTLKGSGSGYQSHVTFVGAEKATLIPMTSTSSMLPAGETVAPEDTNTERAKSGKRRDFINPSDPGEKSDEFPIGEPWMLLLFAAAAAGVTGWRRWRTLRSTISQN